MCILSYWLHTVVFDQLLVFGIYFDKLRIVLLLFLGAFHLLFTIVFCFHMTRIQAKTSKSLPSTSLRCFLPLIFFSFSCSLCVMCVLLCMSFEYGVHCVGYYLNLHAAGCMVCLMSRCVLFGVHEFIKVLTGNLTLMP